MDVDVDSDNDNGFDPPDRSLAEDHYEDIDNDPNHKGKMIPVNSDDKNENEIPDYADGYDKFITTANTNENFVPIVFEIPEPIDLNRGFRGVSPQANK